MPIVINEDPLPGVRNIDHYLTFSDGCVLLDGNLLPGEFVSVTINAGVKFDRAERDHMSGRARIPQGWENADIRLTLDLLTDAESDCYAKLKEINKLFKGADKGANPRIYNVVGRHLRSRGVGRVVFSGLQSDEDNEIDVIRAVLAFSEHLPTVVKREKQANATTAKTAAGGTPPIKATPTPSATIIKDDTNPITAGYETGRR